ncbi:MAG: mechanosensitive ion channel family protein [Breznakibacter sp.]
MRKKLRGIGIFVSLMTVLTCHAQPDPNVQKNDSSYNTPAGKHLLRLAEPERQQLADPIEKIESERRLHHIKISENIQKEHLSSQLLAIQEKEDQRIAEKKLHIESLRNQIKGYPVIGAMGDTLFLVYSKMGASTPDERAKSITKKIKVLYDDDFLSIDSITVVHSESTYDIIYGEMIVASVSETDAMWYNISMPQLANHFKEQIKASVANARNEHSLTKLLVRIALMLMVFLTAWGIVWAIGKSHARMLLYIDRRKDKWLRNLMYKDYTFLTAEQELKAIFYLARIFKWFVYAILLYITLPIVFSIFPFSRGWANSLFHLVWSPFKNILLGVWDYLPNMFTILVLLVAMKYVIKFVRYIFQEIETEKLKISGFHADWAMPTYSIVRFLLYAFTFVLVFPHLPGSESNIFRGVSVFIGILISLGSSSAIANMVAGLVITYMRPFKIGDRIKIGDIQGDVLEKTLLVTRIKTTKNEIVTIPNSTVLSGNTVNYSSEARNKGLIIYTTVTMGYDVPWQKTHQALIDAALRTNLLLKDPKPFVLQTGLDDFYAAYQINAYTQEASMQATIYSELHQHIQDVCNERGIELMSPHYRATRDGNASTIPPDFLPKDYQAPAFNVTVRNKQQGS